MQWDERNFPFLSAVVEVFLLLSSSSLLLLLLLLLLFQFTYSTLAF